MDERTLVDVDKVWIALGRWGSYQRRQILVLLVAVWSCSFHVLSIVFLGFRPDSKCKEIADDNSTYVNITSNVSTIREYSACSIKLVRNHSGEMVVIETGCTDGWTYSENGQFAAERSVVSEWDLVCERKEMAEFSQTLVMFGQGLGALIFTSLSDRFGRKRIHILCHITLFGITLTTAFVQNFVSFAAMRILTGAFQQGTALTIAVLSLELLPKETRFYAEVFNMVFWTTGIAIVTPIAYIFRKMSWRYLQICLACMSAWSLVQWWMIDESLRWLIANGRLQEAKANIKKACKENKKNYEDVAAVSCFHIYEMQKDEDRETREPLTAENGVLERSNRPATTRTYTVVDLVKSRRLFVTSLIMWFAWITNNVTYYGIMLISSSLAGNRFLNFFLGSIVEYPSTLLEYFLLRRYGRKPACILFHCICGISLLSATVLLTNAAGNSAMIVSATVFTLIGKFGITGSFSVIFLYTPELYPTNMRNAGMGLASAAAKIGGMLAPFSRNLAEIAVWGPGLVFGIMCAIVSISMLWIPETSNYELPQTLEVCEQWYKENRFKISCKNRCPEETEGDQETM